ncbi:MAG: dienelactone hydrolase family protein [Patescibacteria group bacterium]
MSPYVYPSSTQPDSETAIIVLPEIFGLTGSIREVVDRFATETNYPSFGLDFFFELTGQPNNFDYSQDIGKGVDLMNQMTGEKFISIFERALNEIQENNPNIQNFTVCGFCFGGRLALLSGTNLKVKNIISFYGGGANQPDFYQKHSAVESLVNSRRNDTELRILAFFGAEDQSIPADDRQRTQGLLNTADLNYIFEVYKNTGHAFFNKDRDTYVPEAATEAWEEVKKFLKEEV